ncbi:CBS domain-containing protein, partial [Candidatus Sumerlaeota bacterium]|nr:CBS domain-containing protein [Candidatus Sumerlaeota bacterium]
MLVSEILKRHNRPVETIGPDQTVQEAIDKLVEKKIGSLLVCEEGGRIVGIITERDILRGSYSRSPRPEKVKVAERMTPDPVRGSPRDSVT